MKLRRGAIAVLGIGLACACPFDETLRAYLSSQFWLPFAKWPSSFEKPNIRRASAPFAGMAAARPGDPLADLRTGYQTLFVPDAANVDFDTLRQSVVRVRAIPSLSARDNEEIELIDAKIDMRDGENGQAEVLRQAKTKMEGFLKRAPTSPFASEARGWLAHIYHLLGDQTAAGKIYLDELNRTGSNLSRETLLTSLRMTYGYDGGNQLRTHLDEYFDTPEHAIFAIQLATNPHWPESPDRPVNKDVDAPRTYSRIMKLIETHRELLKSNELSMLALRTTLRMGNPSEAVKISDSIPAKSELQQDPDFLWMAASARFLTHQYTEAESPLLALFRSTRADEDQKAAAAYALCGVYRKTGHPLEQLRYSSWLAAHNKENGYLSQGVADMSLYWAHSDWDLNLQLEVETPLEVLREFVDENPKISNIRLVKYALAVRLARENRYSESADLFESIHAVRRAPRMRQLAVLYEKANRTDQPTAEQERAKFELASFLLAHENGIYFNDSLWNGVQRYVFKADEESRMTGVERSAQIEMERKLKDDQEERWRAYLILRDIVRDSADIKQKRDSAVLAARCLGGISERFERQKDVQQARKEMLLAGRQ